MAVISPSNADDRYAANDLIDALKNRHVRVLGSAPVRISFLRDESASAKSLLRQRSVTMSPEMHDRATP